MFRGGVGYRYLTSIETSNHRVLGLATSPPISFWYLLLVSYEMNVNSVGVTFGDEPRMSAGDWQNFLVEMITFECAQKAVPHSLVLGGEHKYGELCFTHAMIP